MAETSRLLSKLRVMEYPYELDDTNLKFADLQKLVRWLEDTTIRSLPEDKRADLKTADNPRVWWTHFDEYCRELGYRKPLPFPRMTNDVIKRDPKLSVCLDWLVGRGIRYFYTDRVDEFNAGHEQYRKAHPNTPLYASGAAAPSGGGAAAAPKPKGKPAKAAPASIRVESLEGLRPGVTALCDLLQLTPTDDLEADLALAARTVKQLSVLGAKGQSAPGSAELLDRFPLGFETGDHKLNNACKVLRILYTADLRDLQDKIDETLVKLQNITGDPKTDSRLGRVGS